MILIWGFRVIGKKLSTGQFFCPNCRCDRGYVLKQMRRWFTLFWIPLFPTGKQYGEVVECDACHQTFRPDVLSAPTTAALSDHLRYASRVAAVAMLSVTGPTDERARLATRNLVVTSGTAPYGDAELDADLPHVTPALLTQAVTPLATGLGDPGKEQFLRQVAQIAGGTLSPTQQQVLQSIGATLGMPPTYVAGVIATVGNPVA